MSDSYSDEEPHRREERRERRDSASSRHHGHHHKQGERRVTAPPPRVTNERRGSDGRTSRDQDSPEKDRTRRSRSNTGRKDGGGGATYTRSTSERGVRSRRATVNHPVESGDETSESEEVAEEDNRRSRTKSVYNRSKLESPPDMEGWMNWLSDGVLFRRWKKYYFHLSYPWLNFYEQEPPSGKERAGVKPKAQLNMRGSSLLDSKMEKDSKNADFASTRFRVKGNGKDWVIEADRPELKDAWARVLREHIEHANPAKSTNGVNYNCVANDDEDTPMCLNITLHKLTLVNLKNGKTFWSRPYWQLRTLQRPQTKPSDLFLDFHEYGGTTKLTFTNVPAKVVNDCAAAILDTHREWKGLFPTGW